MTINLEKFMEMGLKPGDPVEVNGVMLLYYSHDFESIDDHKFVFTKLKSSDLYSDKVVYSLNDLETLRPMQYKE